MMKFIFPLLFLVSTVFGINESDKAFLSRYNYLSNPGFESGKGSWTASGGTYSATTTNVLFGKGSVTWDSSAAAQTLTSLDSINTTNYQGIVGVTGEFSCHIRSASGTATHKLSVLSGGFTYEQTITSSSTGVRTTLYFPFPSTVSQSVIPSIVSVAADEPTITIDDCYVGLPNPVTVSSISDPVNAGTITVGATTTAPTKATTPQVDSVTYVKDGKYADITYRYSANPATGGAAGNGTYLFSLPANLSVDSTLLPNTGGVTTEGTLSGGAYSVPASVTFYTASGPAAGFTWYVTMYSTTQFFIKYQQAGAAGNGFVGSANFPFSQVIGFMINIRVPIQGWSAAQAAAPIAQTDYGWTAHTLTASNTQGFGTPTNSECKHRRTKQDLEMECKFQVGTTTATEARVNFPNSLLGVTLSQGIKVAGYWVRGASDTAKGGAVLVESGTGYFVFSDANVFGSGTTNALTKANGSGMTSSGFITFKASVQIAGWEENQRAATLGGSVTSNATIPMRTEYARVGSSGGVAEIGGVDWINGSCAITDGSLFTCTFQNGTFSAEPYCGVTPISSGTGNDGNARISQTPTSSSVVVRTNLSSGTTDFSKTALDFTLTCTGPR